MSCIRGCCSPTATVRLDLTMEDVAPTRKLYEGAMSTVYAGTLAGSPVAIKVPKLRTSAELDLFHHELQLLLRVTTSGAPALSTLAGARAFPPDYFFATGLESCSAADALYDGTAPWRPAWHEVLSVSASAARGLAALHALGYSHGDVKPANILLGPPGTRVPESRTRVPEPGTRVPAVLCDFGLSRPLAETIDNTGGGQGDGRAAVVLTTRGPSGGFHRTALQGTLEYMAPEIFLLRPAGPPADVYALAVSLNEIACGVVPYSDALSPSPGVHTVLEMGYGSSDLAAAVTTAGLRPGLPTGGGGVGWGELMGRCWAKEPAARPTAADAAAELEAMAQSCYVTQSVTQSMTESMTESLAQSHAAAVLNGTVGRAGTDNALLSRPPPPQPTAAASPAAPGSVWATLSAAGAGAGGNIQGNIQGNIRAAAVGAKGLRDHMEDRHVIDDIIIDDVINDDVMRDARLWIGGVFDGHRGAAAAEHATSHCVAAVTAGLKNFPDFPGALAAAFGALDAGILAEHIKDSLEPSAAQTARRPPCSGAAAIVAAVAAGWVHVANAGDCRAMLVRDSTTSDSATTDSGVGDSVITDAAATDSRVSDTRVVATARAVALSRDHTADDGRERSRVIDSGGQLIAPGQGRGGCWRVAPAGLEVTRSLGDGDSTGVVFTPEVYSRRLGPRDACLILASDGLWCALSEREVIRLVDGTVKQPAMLAGRLVEAALAAGSDDNVTCVVAFLRGQATVEQIY